MPMIIHEITASIWHDQQECTSIKHHCVAALNRDCFFPLSWIYHQQARTIKEIDELETNHQYSFGFKRLIMNKRKMQHLRFGSNQCNNNCCETDFANVQDLAALLNPGSSSTTCSPWKLVDTHCNPLPSQSIGKLQSLLGFTLLMVWSLHLPKYRFTLRKLLYGLVAPSPWRTWSWSAALIPAVIPKCSRLKPRVPGEYFKTKQSLCSDKGFAPIKHPNLLPVLGYSSLGATPPILSLGETQFAYVLHPT